MKINQNPLIYITRQTTVIFLRLLNKPHGLWKKQKKCIKYIAQQIKNSVLNWKRKMNIENMEHQIKRKKLNRKHKFKKLYWKNMKYTCIK